MTMRNLVITLIVVVTACAFLLAWNLIVDDVDDRTFLYCVVGADSGRSGSSPGDLVQWSPSGGCIEGELIVCGYFNRGSDGAFVSDDCPDIEGLETGASRFSGGGAPSAKGTNWR
jgi:hypothetical protein